MTLIEKNIHIDAPPARVWSVVIDMQKWPTWYVGLSDIADVSGPNEAGTTYTAKFDLAGVTTLSFDGEVIEVQPEAKWVGKTSGAIDSLATWTYEAVDGGTKVTVEMDYTVSGALLGRIADMLFVEKRNAADLEKTLVQLKALSEG